MHNFVDRPLTRRQAIALAGSLGAALIPGLASNTQAAMPPVNLRCTSRILDVKGKPAKVFGIVDDQGRSGLKLTYGAPFDVMLHNALEEETLIHWHGQIPPAPMDGAMVGSTAALKTGESRRYTFNPPHVGTHWMHSHLGLQEQKLLAAPLIITETAEPMFDEQEHVVIIHDFTFREPAEILEELRKGGGGHAAHDMSKMDHSKMDHSKMDGSMPAMGTAGMINDITFDALLANDRTLDDPEIVVAERGGKFRLRIINACAASNLWIDLGSLQGELIAVDGNAIYPVKGTRFPLATAQRADIRLTLPSGAVSLPVLFQMEGAALRSGIILRQGDAPITRISDQGEPGEIIDLTFEQGIKSVTALTEDPVSRTEMLMLTGGGADYVWGLNGKPSMHDVLFSVREGERIDLMIHNMTSMAHPMHLHGHYFKVVSINGRTIDGALRDTILVPPNQMVTLRFDANNPGTWPLHCHHLYHMQSGMMGMVAYTSAA